MLKRDVTPGTGASMPVSGLHEAANHLASKGIAVFPLRPNTKKGFRENSAREATADLSVIHGWWGNEPYANIGMSTSGFLVLDVDIKDAVDGFSAMKTLEAIHGMLPQTLTQTTPSGGKHYIFRNSTGKHVSSRKNCPAPGIDVRGDGGYIVVAPSIIDGVPYTQHNYLIADAPGWLPDAIDSVPINLAVMDASIEGGSRRRFLFDVARECRRNGMSWEQAELRILMANSKCFPVFGMKELEIYFEIGSSGRSQQPLHDK
jgi:putative DNA primase/helicase